MHVAVHCETRGRSCVCGMAVFLPRFSRQGALQVSTVQAAVLQAVCALDPPALQSAEVNPEARSRLPRFLVHTVVDTSVCSVLQPPAAFSSSLSVSRCCRVPSEDPGQRRREASGGHEREHRQEEVRHNRKTHRSNSSWELRHARAFQAERSVINAKLGRPVSMITSSLSKTRKR